MRIIRRDFESILHVMDKFKLHNEWDSVDLQFNASECGYSLSVKFADVINGVQCNIEVPIEADMFGD